MDNRPVEHGWPDRPLPATAQTSRLRSAHQSGPSHSSLPSIEVGGGIQRQSPGTWPMNTCKNVSLSFRSACRSVQHKRTMPCSEISIMYFQWPIYLLIWRAGSQWGVLQACPEKQRAHTVMFRAHPLRGLQKTAWRQMITVIKCTVYYRRGRRLHRRKWRKHQA